MSQLLCHLFLGRTPSFSPFFAAHTSTVLLAFSVPHLSHVCVHVAQHIPENPTGYFSPTHTQHTQFATVSGSPIPPLLVHRGSVEPVLPFPHTEGYLSPLYHKAHVLFHRYSHKQATAL